MNIFIYFTNIRRFRFSILYFKYLQTLILYVTTFSKTAFYYNVFRNHFIRRDISKYEAVYFMGDNQAINRVRVNSSKTRNRGTFSLAALVYTSTQPLKLGLNFQEISLIY